MGISHPGHNLTKRHCLYNTNSEVPQSKEHKNIFAFMALLFWAGSQSMFSSFRFSEQHLLPFIIIHQLFYYEYPFSLDNAFFLFL